jgi:hypothetical protein
VTNAAPPNSDPDAWQAIPVADLYLRRGDPISERRPYFQGDVFRGVSLPDLPSEMPSGTASIDFNERLVMLLPHPCSCYAGDRLRDSLSVSPVHHPAVNRDLNRTDWTTTAKFPAPGVYGDRGGWVDLTSVHTIPTAWLPTARRVASLTLLGVSWLHKRVLKYMTRLSWPVDNIGAQLKEQWDDVALWEVWSEVRGGLDGYEKWKKQQITIPWLGDVVPKQLIPGRTEHLMAFLRDTEPEE